ncbi:MAG: HAD-IIIA family hydrolase [Candidatus Pacebacteria bacterium]|nr:HAD-IIIA family hydrolase [Candidatus Paceibacterota bacterium]
MKAVILAGGKGTRLFPLTREIPKVLVKIGRKPVIEHQILLLRDYGIKEIWILAGFLGDQIREYLQDGRKWKVKIYYLQEKKPLGTAGALKTLGKIIQKDDFLVFSGDVMLDFDIKRLVAYYRQKKAFTIIVHSNDHPADSDLVEVDNKGKIISLLRRPHPKGSIFRNLSIASAYIFSPKIFKHIPQRRKCDIEKDVLPLILKSKEKVYAYNTPEYIKDIGTPKRLEEVRRDYSSGKIRRLNLKNKRKAVFLDRDGVINKEVDQLSRIKDFELYSFAAKAVKKINESDYLAIIVTNQPMVAKGFMTEKDLNEIHKKLETELGLKGAKIDAIYYCPHHPEKGFVGEVPELKIKCNCRKPLPGLFLKARKDFNIDFKKSYLIGDQERDILAGRKIGCKTILVKTGLGKSYKNAVKPDFAAKNLLEAVVNIIK